MPPVAKLSWPGRDFASAITSFSDLTGTDGLTTMSSGLCTTRTTVAKSLSGS
jgi:hypothetical protein